MQSVSGKSRNQIRLIREIPRSLSTPNHHRALKTELETPADNLVIRRGHIHVPTSDTVQLGKRDSNLLTLQNRFSKEHERRLWAILRLAVRRRGKG